MFEYDAEIINDLGFLELARRDQEALSILNGGNVIRRYSDEELAPRIAELKAIREKYNLAERIEDDEADQLRQEARAERGNEVERHAEDMTTYGKQSF